MFTVASLQHPDGFGWAFTDGERVRVRKFRSLTPERFEMYESEVKEFGNKSPFLVHFRLATHGTVNEANAHPYRLRNGGALVHNGVLDFPATVTPPKRYSDTRYYVKSILNRLPDNWHRSPLWVDLVSEHIGGWNKFAVIDELGFYTIINEKQGEWKDGCWYSNSSGFQLHQTGPRWFEDDYQWPEPLSGRDPLALAGGTRDSATSVALDPEFEAVQAELDRDFERLLRESGEL